MGHTKEPWAHRNGRIYQADRDVLTIANIARAFDGDYSEANARRIVAAVNACAGLSTDLLEKAALTAAHIEARERLSFCTQQIEAERDELQSKLEAERASLFAENQRKQQLEQQVAELVVVLEAMLQEVAGCYCTTEAAARAVIQKVRGE